MSFRKNSRCGTRRINLQVLSDYERGNWGGVSSRRLVSGTLVEHSGTLISVPTEGTVFIPPPGCFHEAFRLMCHALPNYYC